MDVKRVNGVSGVNGVEKHVEKKTKKRELKKKHAGKEEGVDLQKKEKDYSKIKLNDRDKKDVKKISERRVKLALLLSHIGEEHSIKVSSQELQVELEKQLRMYPGQEKIIKEHYEKNPAELTKLRGPIFEDKVMSLIIEKAKVKTKTVTKEELQKLLSKNDGKEVNTKVKKSAKSKVKKSSKK